MKEQGDGNPCSTALLTIGHRPHFGAPPHTHTHVCEDEWMVGCLEKHKLVEDEWMVGCLEKHKLVLCFSPNKLLSD